MIRMMILKIINQKTRYFKTSCFQFRNVQVTYILNNVIDSDELKELMRKRSLSMNKDERHPSDD
jgi:hypothetical protein